MFPLVLIGQRNKAAVSSRSLLFRHHVVIERCPPAAPGEREDDVGGLFRLSTHYSYSGNTSVSDSSFEQAQPEWQHRTVCPSAEHGSRCARRKLLPTSFERSCCHAVHVLLLFHTQEATRSQVKRYSPSISRPWSRILPAASVWSTSVSANNPTM